jgi:hypothetical protein
MYLLTLVGVLLTVTTPDAGEPRASKKTPDPCDLITRAEIGAVQGEKVIDTKSSRPERRDFAVGQCFYTVATFSKSVSLEVTRRDPKSPAAKGPREEWMKLFHAEAKEGDAGREAGTEPGRPLPVTGVGDEAFWSSDGVVGALYVLKAEAYLRISIGGTDEQSVRLEKSKTLARKAVRRL